jgi:transcriptional regulator with XRE-family HTH domain
MITKMRHNELGIKIKDLRASLGLLTQEAFGKRLGAKRSQVSAWEAGKEEPSNEKLIALANLAAYPIQLWFWERAGVDTSKLTENIRLGLSQAKGERALGEVTLIRRMDATALLQEAANKGGALEEPVTDSVPFASLYLPSPATTVCIQVTGRAGGALLRAGDLALVQRAAEPAPHLLNGLIAVLFERQNNVLLPSPEFARAHGKGPLLDLVERSRQRDELERWEEGERDTNKYLAASTAPGVSFGTLRIGSDRTWDGKESSLGLEHPWRLFLDCGGDWKPLTKDWSTEVYAPDSEWASRLKTGTRILGAVIGWLRAPGGTTDE